jgi:hypothetical protein
MLADDGICHRCENDLVPHQGPRVVRRYDYPVRAIARALVDVGGGMSYTSASDRARVAAGRPRQGSKGAQLAANWVERFAPVVAARHTIDTWPETIVLDSTSFQGDSPTGKRVLFHVQVIVGYHPTAKMSHVVALHATPQLTSPDWQSTLTSKAGHPVLAIADGNTAILNAVAAAHPTTTFRWCEYHLRKLLEDRIRVDTIPAGQHAIYETAFNTVFYSPAQFAAAEQILSAGPAAAKWFATWGPKLAPLIAARPNLPKRYSNGAAEAGVRSVKAFIGERAFCFRNAERTNRLLELHRLHMNQQNDPEQYAADIRHHREHWAGIPLKQGRIRDPNRRPSLR